MNWWTCVPVTIMVDMHQEKVMGETTGIIRWQHILIKANSNLVEI